MLGHWNSRWDRAPCGVWKAKMPDGKKNQLFKSKTRLLLGILQATAIWRWSARQMFSTRLGRSTLLRTRVTKLTNGKSFIIGKQVLTRGVWKEPLLELRQGKCLLEKSQARGTPVFRYSPGYCNEGSVGKESDDPSPWVLVKVYCSVSWGQYWRMERALSLNIKTSHAASEASLFRIWDEEEGDAYWEKRITRCVSAKARLLSGILQDTAMRIWTIKSQTRPIRSIVAVE